MAERKPRPINPNAITATVAQFMQLCGLSKNQVFEMIRVGELRSIKFGGRRLIDVEAYRERVRRDQTTPAHHNTRKRMG